MIQSRDTLFRSLLLVLMSLPLLARSDQPNTTPHIGILVPPIPAIFETPLRDSLRELGYVDGRTAIFDVRRSQASPQEFRALADQLVQAKVDLIVAVSTPAARAALEATTTIPVIFGVGDAVSTGIAQSLARPPANGTGVTTMSTEVSAKRLEFVLELVPKARRVAFLYNPSSALGPTMREETQKAAAARHVQLDLLEARDARELDTALQKLSSKLPDGFLVSSEVLFLSGREHIIEVVKKARLPTVFPWRLYAVEGGVVSYGASNEEAMRRMAIYVDKVLKGTKPSELPIEQMSVFNLVTT